MHAVQLSESEIAAIRQLAILLADCYDTVESAEFLRECHVYAGEVPRRVRRELNDFRLTESAGVLVISGWPVADADLVPTPADPRHKPAPSPTLEHDLAFALLASLLGDPIAWATQQDGYVMHDIFPVRGFENDQIGWGSEQTLTWHTEDAFHPLRTDYLGLMCLRNPDQVETTYADVADVRLDDEVRELLSQPRFRVLPDDSHRPELPGGGGADNREALLRRRGRERVERALDDPERVPVLFGDPDDPYVCLDPHYMRGIQGPEEQAALDEICAAIDRVMTGVVLQPGDICFLDNFRVVHGRRPFRARFDGTDRWLRRLNVARDLRKSRASRLRPESRVIY